MQNTTNLPPVAPTLRRSSNTDSALNRVSGDVEAAFGEFLVDSLWVRRADLFKAIAYRDRRTGQSIVGCLIEIGALTSDDLPGLEDAWRATSVRVSSSPSIH